MLTVNQILKHKPPPSPTIDRRRLVWLGKHTIQRIETNGVVVWTFDNRRVVSPANIKELTQLLNYKPIFQETDNG